MPPCSAFGVALPWPNLPRSAPGNGHVTSVNYHNGEEKAAIPWSLVKLESLVKVRKGDKKQAMRFDFTDNFIIR